MAKLFALAVYDVQVGAYMRPMFVPAVGAGIRAFTDEVNRKGSEMNAHPNDYALYRLGEFDESTGVMDSVHPRPELLVQASTVLVREEDPRQMKLN